MSPSVTDSEVWSHDVVCCAVHSPTQSLLTLQRVSLPVTPSQLRALQKLYGERIL